MVNIFYDNSWKNKILGSGQLDEALKEYGSDKMQELRTLNCTFLLKTHPHLIGYVSQMMNFTKNLF